MSRRLFVSAGEPSGDRHLAAVLARLREEGSWAVRGLGGPRSQSQGLESLAPFDRLSVLGFSEVLRAVPFFWRLERRCHRMLDTWRPHAVLLVDYPGFNQRLGRAAKDRGIPVLYYIAPQVWAWKKDRRPGLARCLDHLLAVFPFEPPLFEEAGIRTTFVGHPLLDAEPADPPGPAFSKSKRVALLPGSRRQEVASLLPVLVEAVETLGDPEVEAVVSRHPQVDPDLYAPARQAGLPLWDGPIRGLLEAADASVVASGTATLEAGLAGKPMAVVYRTGWFNWQLARRLVRLRTVALVNIAAGGARVPELLQGDCTPGRVADVMGRLLDDERERIEQEAYLKDLRHRLGSPGAAERVANIVRKAAEAAP